MCESVLFFVSHWFQLMWQRKLEKQTDVQLIAAGNES